jgi:IS605 OrfB family transposase
MSSLIIRAETHALRTSPAERADVARTIAADQRAVRALATVIQTHWPDLARAKSRCQALEALCHATKLRPAVRYPMIDRLLGKMPSYLRRAAIEAAFGVVESFLSNYDNWLSDSARERGSRPPRLGVSGVFPSLYGGNMIKAAKGLGSVEIKLLGADGQWRFSAPLKLHGRLKRLPQQLDLSPTLILRGAKVRLACPVTVRRPAYPNMAVKGLKSGVKRVLAIDVGINTAATAAIVDSTGTVIARTSLTCGRHNDRRDALAADIAQRQRQSHGATPGFCQTLHQRIAGLSLDAARGLAARLMAFAVKHGAQAVVLEDLKGWRPKGGSRAQRKRFHRFQHRMLVKHLAAKAEEAGMPVLNVYPRGTSRWAYDGSGKVRRAPGNAQLATFASGKQYNADLNAAYNIAARGLARLLGVEKKAAVGDDGRGATGKSSGASSRMPIVLADIWAYAQASAAAH